MQENLSIYIHYPFCKAKCPYCDFNSHVREGVNHESFLRAYEKEMEFFAPKTGLRKIKTIFFGGGTPSLMPIFLVEGILKKISQLWNVDENCEISLEANPTSFEAAKFKDLRRVGINRLSLGIQALNDADLKFLGREHSAKEAIATIETAQKIFDNFSFDLIYARPQQTLELWHEELLRAINFGTKHLSLYQLTIEKGTKFFSEFKQGKFKLPEENLATDFYSLTNQVTSDAGFKLYEISNYAYSSSLETRERFRGSHESKLPKSSVAGASKDDEFVKDYRCAHNLVYWQGGDYLGIGAGAHSRIYLDGEKNRSAIMMIHEPNAWLRKVEENSAGIQTLEKISSEELLEELILMGLRLENGIDKKNFPKKFADIFDFKKLQKLVDQGLIVISENHIKIPHQYRILTNSIISKVVSCFSVCHPVE